ncbi:TIGR00730 family Rossman fold protein [Campylobacter sp. RM16187]|uniref:LOG family protein n=1 Tax=Campylobacter sp. RM16187 TaxID=1660063 RepID=UPI0021B6335F|nr:TIGR00730 family Rossman fold protein [Campylobacter sp. RM16187]QKG28673.1 putative lysine decarboxylase family protein [Campylobacter sp. RM16187]
MEEILNDLSKFRDFLAYKNPSVTFFGSARFEPDNKYCKMAYELAFALASEGFAIISGGGGGIMEAANKAAYDSGKSPSIGLNIVLPFEQVTNPYATDKFVFSNLNARKFALIERSKAFLVFPGGFGTLDELFEILVLAQIGRKKSKIYLIGSEFWSKLDDFIKTTLINEKSISKEDLNIYEISDDLKKISEGILKI